MHAEGQHLSGCLCRIGVGTRTHGREADDLLARASHQQHVPRTRWVAQRVSPDTGEAWPVEALDHLVRQNVGVRSPPDCCLHQTDGRRVARPRDPGAGVSDRDR
jgi:hypothetical protein